MMPSWDHDIPSIIGHRGSPLVAPENTLASFRAAVTEGAQAVELDVRLTRDDEVVVMHDAALGRMVVGSGLVETMDAAPLRALDAGKGEHVPTLREVLREFPALLIDVEIKADAANAEALPKRVAQVVREESAVDRVLVTSFEPTLASEYAALVGRDAGFIVPFPITPEDVEEFVGIKHVMLVADAAEREVIAPFVRRGIRVHVWTVNDSTTAMELLARGASSVITDRPGRLLRALRASEPAP
ncbi:MAG: glycerophosphodiester phosphodiesterase family protein [Candidatus Thermoplasmatota archaeon]